MSEIQTAAVQWEHTWHALPGEAASGLVFRKRLSAVRQGQYSGGGKQSTVFYYKYSAIEWKINVLFYLETCTTK